MLKLPSDRVIITVCVTGSMVNKTLTPASPESSEEVAEAARECYQEGAAIVHSHAKNRQETLIGDPAVFRETHNIVRATTPLIIQDSTGGGANLALEQLLACLDAHLEIAPLNMGTLLRVSKSDKRTLFSIAPWDVESWASRMKEMGIKPEMEVYSHSVVRDVENATAYG